MKLLGVLAQGSIVLLNKVPANLVLREVSGGGARGACGLGGGGHGGPCVLVLVIKITVCCHGCGDVRGVLRVWSDGSWSRGSRCGWWSGHSGEVVKRCRGGCRSGKT